MTLGNSTSINVYWCMTKYRIPDQSGQNAEYGKNERKTVIFGLISLNL